MAKYFLYDLDSKVKVVIHNINEHSKIKNQIYKSLFSKYIKSSNKVLIIIIIV